MSQKQCSKCRKYKNTSEFHINRSSKDGLNYSCKQCQWEYNHSPAGRAARARYAKTKAGKTAHIKAQQNYRKKEKNRKTLQSRDCRYKRNNPEKVKARNKIANEVLMGRMPSAQELECAHCGEPAMGYHHFNGYSEEHWLEVIPLCRQCDVSAHKEMDQ